MRVIVASQNPVKIAATRSAFIQVFPHQEIICEGISVPSGVSDQPMDQAETRLGARNRAHGACEAVPEADFWVGLEGGISESQGEMLASAWMYIWDGKRAGTAHTAGFPLPPAVSRLVRQGIELGVADDQVFGQSNSKQQNGAVGLLTHNLIVRETLYAPAVILALIPFLQADLYPQTTSEPS